MWIEELSNGKYKYFERYRDPLSEKLKKVSVTLESGSARAKKEAQRLLNEKIEGKLTSVTTTEANFIDIFNEWWKFYKQSLKNTSISSLTSIINYVNETFDKDVKIKNVTAKVIQNYLNDMAVSQNKIERTKSMLNLAFDYAVNLEYLTDNPARKAKLPKVVKTLDDLEKTKNKFLESHELKALLNELYRRPSTYRLALIAEFMSLNGCRMGEAIALQTANYRRAEKKIDIHGTLDKTVGYGKGVKTTPKNAASYRTVDLSNREIEILDEMIEMNNLSKNLTKNYKDMGFIFVSKRGIPIQNNSFNLALKKANTRLETPINKNLSSHIFRHTLVSLLAEKNVPLKAIMDRVGHQDGSRTTMEIYTHVTENMKSKIIDILNDLSS